MTEEQCAQIESVANTLRGLSLDPRIPSDAKECLMEQAAALEEIASEEDTL